MSMVSSIVRTGVRPALRLGGRVLTPQQRCELYGYWQNPDGYTAYPRYRVPGMWSKWGFRWSLFPMQIYEFTLDRVNPLTYVDKDGGRWQPDRHMFSDRASVPNFAHSIIDPGCIERPGWLHDSGYEDEGLYYCPPNGSLFEFRSMSRNELDTLLRWMALADVPPDSKNDVTESEAQAVYLAVYAGGWVPWNSHGPEHQKKMRELNP